MTVQLVGNILGPVGATGPTLPLPLGQHLTFAPDNTYDIGADAASRPRDVYVGRVLQTPLMNAPLGTLTLQTSGIDRWQVVAAGHLLAATNNAFDIGAVGGNRPRDIYGRNVNMSSNVTAGSITIRGGSNEISFSNSPDVWFWFRDVPARFHFSHRVLAPYGSAANPGYTFSTESLTPPHHLVDERTGSPGLFSPGDGRIAIATDGLARWEVNDSGHLIVSTGNTGTVVLGRDPTADLEAATKQYVDNELAALEARVAALEGP